ncbi:MAG: hypothetical protein QM537_10175 [Candidatus Symbiobacter sp.]|nr:hypothetical protein [Candidatus Symbiobacter sp.]
MIETARTSHRCDHPECHEEGKYPAPQSRDKLRDYYWFCLEHVREYNRKWDYYAGMKPEEIELALVSDMTWNRPSWVFGLAPGYAKEAARAYFGDDAATQTGTSQAGTPPNGNPSYFRAKFSDPFDLFRQASADRSYDREQESRQDQAPPGGRHGTELATKRALNFFGLVPPFSEASLKARFKQLVKIHHPDANLGDKAAEERLKQVIADYHLLRRLFHPLGAG